MSTTYEHSGDTGPRPATPRASSPTTCGCGQDLDRCTAGHCPRCGTQLGSFRFEATGFWREVLVGAGPLTPPPAAA